MDESQKSIYLKDIEYFSKKLKENPKSKVFMPLAMAYLKLGKYDEAIEICTKGLDNDPDYIAAKTILAQAFLGKGMLNEAKGLLLEVATFSKDNHRANKLLGEIYRVEGNIEKAIYYYRTAALNSPEDLELRRLIEELAMTVDATPKELDDIKEEEPEVGDETIKEEPSDLTEMAKDLADEVIEDVRRGGYKDEDILTVESQLEELISAGEYEKALAYANEKIQSNPELLNKKIAEIDAYMKNENTSQEVLISEDAEENEVEDTVEIKNALEIDDLNLDVEQETDQTEDLFRDDLLDFTEEGTKEEEFALNEKLTQNDLELDSEEEIGTDISFSDIKAEGFEEERLDESELDANFDKKLKEFETVNPNKEVIEKLESWVNNIRRVKEKRDV